MKLILKLIAAPFVVLLTVLVAVLLFLFSLSSFFLTAASVIMALLGVGLFFIELPGGQRHLSGNCVPAFALRLAGGGGRCHYGAEQLKPVSAAIHHKLIASGQVVPK
ncbi:MAG: hypothetical protein ACLUE8_04410 [Lachnospiraceae bacterium]